MAIALKLTSVGTSTGVVIPKEMMARMNMEKGEVLHVSETPDGYLLTPYDPEVAEQIKHARQVMKEHREALRALAK